MKKKRFLPMCLCLVLALGLSACNDLEDLADSGGDDETSEVGPTETGDGTEPGGGEGPSESVPTYSIQIVDPSGDLQLEVGESATIAVSLVTTVDNTDSSVAGTASEVTLYSSDSTVVSVEGLTITALTEGEAVITATWTEHGVTSSDLNVTVTESVVAPNPDVITYKVVITSPETGDEIEINKETVVSVNLITITNGVEGAPVAATSSDVTIKESGSSILSINELTITGLVEGEATIIATWNDHIEATDSITITIKNSNPSSGEGGEDVTTYGVSISSPTSATVLKVGETLNVEASLITYTNGSETSRETANYGDVELTQTGEGSVTISNESLTITGATAGEVTLTVTWTDHVGITGTTASASVTFAVESVYTYAIEISNPTTATTLKVGDTLDVSATLITYTDETPTGSENATGSNVVVTQTGGTGSVDVSGLTIKGVSAGEVTLTVSWGEYATEEVTFEVISVTTYGVEITSPTSGKEVEVGSTLTFTVDLITYTDGVETSRDTSVSSGVTLSASSGGEVEISGLTITGKTAGEVTITATDSYGNTDAVTIKVIEATVFESYTYVITFYNSSNESFGTLPEGTELYAAGSFNGSGNLVTENGESWYEWGDENVKLTDNGNGTFNLVLDILPRVGLDINIYAHDTSAGDPSADMWGHYIAYHLITEDDLNDATGTSNLIYTLSLWSEDYSSWEDVFKAPETRENVKVTWYFVDSATNPTQYYSIPAYADAYVTGEFVGTDWTDYEIGGNTKLVSDSNNGYTVTFSEINVGEVTYNMYFEYNNAASNHNAATNPSWDKSHAISSSDITMTIPESGDVTIYIELDPAEIITDDADFCEVTLALKGSSGSSATSTIYYAGSNNSWAVVSLTKTTNNDSYDYYVTFNVDKGSSIECGIYSNSTWGDSLQVTTNSYNITNSGNDIVIPSSLTNYDSTLIIFTCDLSGFTGSGSSHVTASSISVSY